MHLKGGYPMVNIHDGQKKRLRTVHSLVAEAFIGPRPDGLQVRHHDGNALNCCATNLLYGTQSDNEQDKRQHGRNANTNKTHCPSGHEYDEENTRVYQGRRYCRRCGGWGGTK